MFLTLLYINKILHPISYIEGSHIRKINRNISLGYCKEAIHIE